jgi:hypothetical protein
MFMQMPLSKALKEWVRASTFQAAVQFAESYTRLSLNRSTCAEWQLVTLVIAGDKIRNTCDRSERVVALRGDAV